MSEAGDWRHLPVRETRKGLNGSATRRILEALAACDAPAVVRRRGDGEAEVITLEVPAALLLELQARPLRREPLPGPSGPADPKALLELLELDLPAAARRDFEGEETDAEGVASWLEGYLGAALAPLGREPAAGDPGPGDPNCALCGGETEPAPDFAERFGGELVALRRVRRFDGGGLVNKRPVVVPSPVEAADGTRIVFWPLRPGTRYSRRSRGLGATFHFPDGSSVRTWGTSLRQRLNVTPGVAGLNKLCERAAGASTEAGPEAGSEEKHRG